LVRPVELLRCGYWASVAYRSSEVRRLAAAQSMRPPWQVATVKRVANATKNERHPVVSQAMVRLLSQMLNRPPSKMSASVRSSIMTGALAQIGLAG